MSTALGQLEQVGRNLVDAREQPAFRAYVTKLCTPAATSLGSRHGEDREKAPRWEMPVKAERGLSLRPAAKHGRSLSRRLRALTSVGSGQRGRKQKAEKRPIRQMW